MNQAPVSELNRRITEATKLYSRLVVLVGRSGSGKSEALQELGAKIHSSIVNVNLELSRRMLELTERQRVLRSQQLLGEIVSAISGDVTLLDNLEILFHPGLRQDPLRLLEGLSRNTTIVVAWGGSIIGGHLVYAEPGHREYRRYPVQDFLVVSAESR